MPRYGFHLDSFRRGRRHFELAFEPADWADWGAVGALVGRRMRSWFDVPVISGVRRAPTSDELEHLGAALASFGSTPMFHLVGVTPEASTARDAFDGPPPPAERIGVGELETLYRQCAEGGDRVDCVVFAAPQLSLFELARIAAMLHGRREDPAVALILCTTEEVAAAAARSGIRRMLEEAGARILEGV